VLCVVKYKSLCRADHSSRGVLPSVVCLSDHESSIMRRPWPTRGCWAKVKKSSPCTNTLIYHKNKKSRIEQTSAADSSRQRPLPVEESWERRGRWRGSCLPLTDWRVLLVFSICTNYVIRDTDRIPVLTDKHKREFFGEMGNYFAERTFI